MGCCFSPFGVCTIYYYDLGAWPQCSDTCPGVRHLPLAVLQEGCCRREEELLNKWAMFDCRTVLCCGCWWDLVNSANYSEEYNIGPGKWIIGLNLITSGSLKNNWVMTSEQIVSVAWNSTKCCLLVVSSICTSVSFCIYLPVLLTMCHYW